MHLLYRIAVNSIIALGILLIAYSQLSLVDSPNYPEYVRLQHIGLIGLVVVTFGAVLKWVDHMSKK